jgi:EAL domain-containing protein (putative c-di-GMP-specific phosphodiesterase class I)
LQNLDELGVNLAIDDFGTGYSALSYLLHLPVDRIKLDRAFTSAVAEGADGAAFITAIVHLAHALNLTVTAEGVESAPLAAALAAAGCDYGQGHHLGLPVP